MDSMHRDSIKILLFEEIDKEVIFRIYLGTKKMFLPEAGKGVFFVYFPTPPQGLPEYVLMDCTLEQAAKILRVADNYVDVDFLKNQLEETAQGVYLKKDQTGELVKITMQANPSTNTPITSLPMLAAA